METRPFGKTGESFPILSFGGQRIVDGHNCTEDEAVRIVNTAIDRGIRYFDTAWVYSDGQAETRLGKVVKHRRKEMWIATKTDDRSRDGALRQLGDQPAAACRPITSTSGACTTSSTMPSST